MKLPQLVSMVMMPSSLSVAEIGAEFFEVKEAQAQRIIAAMRNAKLLSILRII